MELPKLHNNLCTHKPKEAGRGGGVSAKAIRDYTYPLSHVANTDAMVGSQPDMDIALLPAPSEGTCLNKSVKQLTSCLRELLGCVKSEDGLLETLDVEECV